MNTILAIVQAEKEGQIESKMMKARQLEEIRQAREKESEARQVERKSKLVIARAIVDLLSRRRQRPQSASITVEELDRWLPMENLNLLSRRRSNPKNAFRLDETRSLFV